MEQEPNISDAPPVMQVEQDQFCVGCSYNLRGLPVSGRCPECGALVERSLRGDLLEYSSPEYLESLSKGLYIVVVGTIAQLVIMVALVIATIVVALAVQGAGPATRMLEVALSWINVLFAAAIVFGWYMFSTPDPAIAGSDKGDTPRKVVRIAAIASIALTMVAAVVEMLPTAPANPSVPVMQEIAAGSAGTLSGIAGIVLYFASLIYVRWIAKRIPDEKLDADAKRLMWLGPLLYIVLACLFLIGPLIAIILYLILLNQTRKFIEVIRESQAPLYPA